MKNTNLRLFLLAITLLGFSACETINQMDSDITTLKSDVASLKKETQSLQDLRKEVADLSTQVDETQNNLQEIRGQVDNNQHSVDKSLKEIRARIGSLEQNTSIGVSSSSPLTPGVTPPSTSISTFFGC